MGWQSQLDNMMKEFGNKVTGNNAKKEIQSPSTGAKNASAGIVIGIGPQGNNAQTDKYQQLNIQMKQTLDTLHSQVDGMQKELDRLKIIYQEAGSGNEAMTAKVNAQFAKEKDALIRDYELQSQNLTGQLQELRRQIDAKTAMDSRATKKGFGSGFKLGGSEEDYRSQIDTEKKILDTFSEDERATIKFLHRHLHRNTHRHLHNHKHIHLHKDAEDNVDNVDIADLELEDKHTITHTITHSNTQFQIKKGFF